MTRLESPGSPGSVAGTELVRVMLSGPARHAVSGVSTHLNQLFGSSLAVEFTLIQWQVGSEGRSEQGYQRAIRYLSSPMALAVCLARRRPDIVHLNTSLDPRSFWRDLSYLIVAKAMRRRVVYQVHGGELPHRFFSGRRALTGALRWLLSLPDAVVVLAGCEAEAYGRFASIRCLRTIPNAIELKEFGSLPKKAFDAETIKLGYIGRLAEDKGIFEIVEALRLIRERGSVSFQIHWAGSGPAEAVLRQSVKAAGLEEYSTFLGPIFGDQKLEFWKTTDLFLFPTYHREGLPYTVLESLASGTPMITTRVGGIPDAITDGVHGLFVASKAPEDLADAIERAAGDRDWLRTASTRCRERAAEQYTIDRLARQFSEVYRAVLG